MLVFRNYVTAAELAELHTRLQHVNVNQFDGCPPRSLLFWGAEASLLEDGTYKVTAQVKPILDDGRIRAINAETGEVLYEADKYHETEFSHDWLGEIVPDLSLA